MGFPQELPKDAFGALVRYDEQDTEHLALAAYELLGYGLGLYFGDVKWQAGLDFETISKIAETADDVTKIKARALELKKSGMGIALIILQLLAEFGPKILKLVQNLRELLKKE